MAEFGGLAYLDGDIRAVMSRTVLDSDVRRQIVVDSDVRRQTVVDSDVRRQTVLDLLEDDELQSSIVTFSERLDQMIGGGVPLTKLTEICGVPGSGKTQLCLQLAADVQIPECFGGVQGESLYIDTEQTFLVERFEEIASSTVEHCRSNSDGSAEQEKALKEFSIDSVLNGLHYIHCPDSLHLIAFIEKFPEILDKHKKIKLIVIDSMAFHFRTDYEDYSVRTRILAGLAQKLVRTAVERKLAVVLTNHLTTKFSTDRSTARFIPALGDTWSHVASTRILLDVMTGNKRTATLLKSSLRPRQTVEFQIVSEGVRDVDITADDVTDSLMLEVNPHNSQTGIMQTDHSENCVNPGEVPSVKRTKIDI